jgi:hypothetical protein
MERVDRCAAARAIRVGGLRWATYGECYGSVDRFLHGEQRVITAGLAGGAIGGVAGRIAAPLRWGAAPVPGVAWIPRIRTEVLG